MVIPVVWALGGRKIAVFAIIIRKELLIPILCGIFLVETFQWWVTGRLI